MFRKQAKQKRKMKGHKPKAFDLTVFFRLVCDLKPGFINAWYK